MKWFVWISLFILLVMFFCAKVALSDQLKISGTTNTDDAQILYNRPWGLGTYDPAVGFNNNYGATTTGYITTLGAAESDTTFYRFFIRPKNLSSLLPANANVTACVCSLYCSTNSIDGNVSAYRVLKPWVEGDENGTDNDDGDITYADWASDASEWGTFGCMNAADSVDNSGDGTRPDRWTTAMSTVNVTTVNTWYSWTVDTATVNGWYHGTMTENGIVFIAAAGANNRFYCSEYTTDTTLIPRFFITYTVSAPTNNRRNNLIRKIMK